MTSIIAVVEKNSCDGGGYRRVVFIEKSEGNVMGAAGCDAALQENNDRNCRQLLEAIEYRNAKQNFW